MPGSRHFYGFLPVLTLPLSSWAIRDSFFSNDTFFVVSTLHTYTTYVRTYTIDTTTRTQNVDMYKGGGRNQARVYAKRLDVNTMYQKELNVYSGSDVIYDVRTFLVTTAGCAAAVLPRIGLQLG